jgi:hypothetical protein
MQQTTAATLEGILHFKDDRSDGQLRDPAHPLRPLSGGVFVSRQLIKELHLRPGLMVKGQPKGKHLTKLHSTSMTRSPSTPTPCSSSSTTPTSTPPG